jgi:hypothetical protein
MASAEGGAGKVPKVFTERAKAAKAAMDAHLSMLEAKTKADLTMQKARAKQLLSGMQFTGSQMDEARQAKADQQAAGQEEPVGPEVSVAPYPDAAQPSSSLAGAQGLSVTPESVSGGAAVQQATGGMGRAAGAGGDSPYRVTTQVQQGSVPVEGPGEVRMIPRTTTQTQIAPNTLSVAEKARLLMEQMRAVQAERIAEARNSLAEKVAAQRQKISEAQLLINERNANTNEGRLAVSQENARLAAIREARIDQHQDDGLTQRTSEDYNRSIKDLNVRGDFVNSARETLREARAGNQVATRVIRNQLPRVAGEVGALTEGDKKIDGQALLRRIESYYQKMATGTLSKGDADDMESILDAFDGAINSAKAKRATSFAYRLSQAKDGKLMDYGTAYGLVAPGLEPLPPPGMKLQRDKNSGKIRAVPIGAK